jgi:TetR/AcrR family transcriptional regulator, transcriptional repressor for nem operon
MGRNRSFDEQDVVAAACSAFVSTGYEGTSVDDLVAATGLFRGSLYKAFGSKRGLFLAALESASSRDALTDLDLDLLMVALLDVAPSDVPVREVCGRLMARVPGADPASVLGERLVTRAGLATTAPRTPRRSS